MAACLYLKMGGFLIRGAGRSSADDLVGRVGIPDDDLIEIRGILREVIDYARYIVTIGSKSGVVTIWWGD